MSYKKLMLSYGKRGVSGHQIGALIGALIFVVIMVGLAPSMFENITTIAGAPSWFGVALQAVIAGGLAIATWGVFTKFM